MAASRKRLPIYFAVIAISLIALALDRFSRSSGPETAVAQEVPSPTLPDAAENGVVASIEVGSSTVAAMTPRRPPENLATSIPRKPFPPGIQTWDAGDGIRDPFRTAPSESDAGSEENSSSLSHATSSARKSAGHASTFPVRHQLQAVMLHPTLPLAIIDGRTLRNGDVMDGCTVSRIETRRVNFQCPDGSVDLELGPPRLPSDGK